MGQGPREGADVLTSTLCQREKGGGGGGGVAARREIASPASLASLYFQFGFKEPIFKDIQLHGSKYWLIPVPPTTVKDPSQRPCQHHAHVVRRICHPARQPDVPKIARHNV